jgi:hypothetical protein
MAFCLSLAFLLSLLSLSLSPSLTNALDPQTPTQRRVVERARDEAVSASQAAEADARQLFADVATRRYLKEFDDGSRLYERTADDLYESFWNEIASAELVHSFGDGDSDSANCGYDISVSIGRDSDVFWNQWQLQSLQIVLSLSIFLLNFSLFPFFLSFLSPSPSLPLSTQWMFPTIGSLSTLRRSILDILPLKISPLLI